MVTQPALLDPIDLQFGEEAARRSLPAYGEWMWPHWRHFKHTDLLCETLEKVERREITRLIIVWPPQHGKSIHVSQLFPAWWLGRNPRDNVILASYALKLATRNSRFARDLMNDARSPFQTRVRADTASVEQWMTEEGGGLLAVGTGSGLTGHSGTFVSVDDPHPDGGGLTEKERDDVWRWFNEVVLTRLAPDGVVVVTMTRWHTDDLVGRILSSPGAEKWTVLHVPAIATAADPKDDPLGREQGEVIWPEVRPKHTLPSVKDGYPAESFESLYQGNPILEGGNMLKEEWIRKRWSQLPPAACSSRIGCSGQRSCEHLEQREDKGNDPFFIVASADTATKTGERNSYSVFATWATDLRHYYLINVWRKRVLWTDLREAAIELWDYYRHSDVLIEDKSSGITLIQDLLETTDVPAWPVPAVQAGIMRFQSVLSLFRRGRVILPEDAPWLNEWVAEHIAYDRADHDDQVDTTSIALYALAVDPIYMGRFLSTWGRKALPRKAV